MTGIEDKQVNADGALAAEALYKWIPKVLQCVRPWMSRKSVEPGSRGLNEVARALEGIKVGITCLTRDNLDATWILFEAGALSKTVDDKTRLCTYLLDDLRPEDIKQPLGAFQACMATKEQTFLLLLMLNKALGTPPMAEADLQDIFEAMWQKLDNKLKELPPLNSIVPIQNEREMIAEILQWTRIQTRQQALTVDDLIAYEIGNEAAKAFAKLPSSFQGAQETLGEPGSKNSELPSKQRRRTIGRA
jgi:hypothetical protein